jgi:hypothetical protein
MIIAEQAIMSGFVTGGPKALLRAEGLAVLALATLAYWRSGGAWWIYAVCFLAPDLTMLGYLSGSRYGAMAYNLGHTYVAPVACLGLGLLLPLPPLVGASLIWAAHIGFDRLLGYGLKYGQGFGVTHLGLVGTEHASADAATQAGPADGHWASRNSR